VVIKAIFQVVDVGYRKIVPRNYAYLNSSHACPSVSVSLPCRHRLETLQVWWLGMNRHPSWSMEWRSYPTATVMRWMPTRPPGRAQPHGIDAGRQSSLRQDHQVTEVAMRKLALSAALTLLWGG
jgi:hypothetical protein